MITEICLLVNKFSDVNIKKMFEKNVVMISIVFFVFTFYIINASKPSFLYGNDGSLRVFGVGYRNKTILPVWLFALVLGILCYISVRYYFV
jgi:hypothetical protein